MSQESAPKIVVRGHARKPKPSKEFLEECFEAQFFRGKLIWKVRPTHHFSNPNSAASWNSRFAGQEAGSRICNPDGSHRYPHVGLKGAANGKAYLYSVHFVMWIMAGRNIPEGMEIDHKNRDPWDNRLRNLRLGNPSDNVRNIGSHKEKKSKLPKWVFRDRKCLIAKVVHNGASHHLGFFQDTETAHLAAFRKATELHGPFANCGCNPQCKLE